MRRVPQAPLDQVSAQVLLAQRGQVSVLAPLDQPGSQASRAIRDQQGLPQDQQVRPTLVPPEIRDPRDLSPQTHSRLYRPVILLLWVAPLGLLNPSKSTLNLASHTTKVH